MLTEKDVVKKQLHITGMVMSGRSWIFALSNLEIFAKIIHGFQMPMTVTKVSMTDVKIFEFEPL